MMQPGDRRAALDEIRRRLKKGKSCRVISTSLVEAGVDVDFPTVYRAMAGLDSIIQAGGRCNREGKNSPRDSVVYYFDCAYPYPESMAKNIAATRKVMDEYKDIASADAIKAYFDFLLYVLKDEDELDSRQILKSARSGQFAFASVADRFKLINEDTYTLYIPTDENAELIEKLNHTGPERGLMRKLGQYAVEIYPEYFRELIKIGAAKAVAENAAILADERLYDKKTGLCLKAWYGQANFA